MLKKPKTFKGTRKFKNARNLKKKNDLRLQKEFGDKRWGKWSVYLASQTVLVQTLRCERVLFLSLGDRRDCHD